MTNLCRGLLHFLAFSLVLRTVSASYDYDNIIDDGYSATSLTPNQFYKICPRQNRGKPFGSPICGDGTDFCFYFSRPSQRKANNERIIIELMGGGACWDANTCSKMAQYLTFPEDLDNFVGLSCSEINAGLSNEEHQDKPINMLCAQTIGETDFTNYNTVVIPYCTQDVHVGSNIMDYSNDGRRLEDYDTTVRHMGAHNVMSTLRWVFRNFPAAKHIALTGCSAGGTGLPIVYDLIRKNYNHFGVRKVQINTIADSPVYLTPSYFLENALDHWNPWEMLKRVGFNYNKYRYSEEYPTQAWDYILRNGNNRDRWGFVSHTDDPVSLVYYQYMSGSGENRRLDEDMESRWYSELASSLDTIQAKHKNVETYWINDEGHCSFGLYYALQEDGFADWAGGIFRESAVSMAPRPAVGAFFIALFVGVGLATGIVFASRKKSGSTALDTAGSLCSEKSVEKAKLWRCHYASRMQLSSFALETVDSLVSDKTIERQPRMYRTMVERLKLAVIPFLSKFTDYPVTAGLSALITVFFWTMIITEGFAHPLNNPSLGPSAIGLSRYGINNPSLIIYKHQWFRILTANFLCSGVLTYLITMLYLAYTVRSLEMTLASPQQTVWVFMLVALGINLMYALLLEGATCSTLALVLGLQTCQLVLRQRRNLPNRYIFPLIFLVIVFFLSVLFPFNDLWMILSSILFFGPVAGWLGFKVKPVAEEGSETADMDRIDDQISQEYVGEPMEQLSPETTRDDTRDEQTSHRMEGVSNEQDGSELAKRDGLIHDEPAGHYALRKEFLFVYAVWFVLLVLGLGFGGPDALYIEPFYTGCDLYYSTEVTNIASGFYVGDGDRRLDDEVDESMCAEFCVPHITSRFVKIGVDKLGIAVSRGHCEDAGYGEHVADKTFAYMSYSLDVEIYYSSE